MPLLDDLEWFLKDETRTFYAKHGIPYHRCYLLHGEPGTGKTSFMNSVAGHIQRNLCFIQMDKHMTDDTFRALACVVFKLGLLHGCISHLEEDLT